MNMDVIQLTIDGQAVEVQPGTTLLDAAKTSGIDIPLICYHELTTAEGICRQCVVEIEGYRLLQPACITKAQPGMIVHTASERVVRTRRTILEMLAASVDLSDAPDIQQQMRTYEAKPERFLDAEKRGQTLIDDNPFYLREYQKCIQCWRCVQACADDMQFTYALAIGSRGFDSHIITFFGKPLPETTCVFCGNCVAVCPTGALKGKAEFQFERGPQPNKPRTDEEQQKKNTSKYSGEKQE